MPIGQVIEQNFDANYCGDTSKESETLKVKIVDIHQQEN